MIVYNELFGHTNVALMFSFRCLRLNRNCDKIVRETVGDWENVPEATLGPSFLLGNNMVHSDAALFVAT